MSWYNYPKTNKLYVKNIQQKALFINELQGQFSDGHWENASPWDHWKIWCDLSEDQVEIHPVIGRNFFPRREEYGLTSKALLDVVGARMIALGRLVTKYDLKTAFEIHDIAIDAFTSDVKAVWRGIPNDESRYWDSIRERASKLNIDWDEAERIVKDETLYDMQKMRKDLKELKSAMMTYRIEVK